MGIGGTKLTGNYQPRLRKFSTMKVPDSSSGAVLELLSSPSSRGLQLVPREHRILCQARRPPLTMAKKLGPHRRWTRPRRPLHNLLNLARVRAPNSLSLLNLLNKFDKFDKLDKPPQFGPAPDVRILSRSELRSSIRNLDIRRIWLFCTHPPLGESF